MYYSFLVFGNVSEPLHRIARVNLNKVQARHFRILADQLCYPISTRRPDYAHHITTGTPGFSGLPTALKLKDFGTNATAALTYNVQW